MGICVLVQKQFNDDFNLNVANLKRVKLKNNSLI